MNQIYFEFPFLHINNYQIMPSLIVFFIFLVILLIRFILRVLRNLIKQNITISGYIEKSVEDFKISIKNFKFIKKILSFFENRNIWRYTFLSVTSYGMIFLLSYFLKGEKYLGDRANIIVKLANAYLKIELLVVLIMFFAFMYIFLVNKNKNAYFEFLKKPIVLLVYISAFSYAVTHQIELGYKYNWVGYILLAVFSMLIFLVDIKDKIIENEQVEKRNQYNPIKNYDDLCKSHQGKADALKNIIERNSNCGGISILVKGDWGIGKTSVVNGAIQKLKKDSKYEELRINALEIDSLESLFNYFFDFIRRCLKERGSYTGIASEYREFVSSALGIVTTESFGNLFTRFFYSENKDYRGKKEELEKSIKDVLGKDKIIIVVDDIERCEKEKVKQFIFFIKEIATMNNCITIFISDEEALKECILNDNNSTMDDFLDKFFNYTVSVNTTEYEGILEAMEKTEKILNNELGFLTLNEVINKIIKNWDEKIKEAQKREHEENVVENLKEVKHEFKASINNPRKLIKLYNSYLNYQNDLILNFEKFGNDKDNKNREYLEQINASKLIFSLAYIFEYISEKSYLIELFGIDYFLEKFEHGNNTKKKLLKEMIEELDGVNIDPNLKRSYIVYANEYFLSKKKKFIDNLIKNEEITPDTFTNKEQKLLDYVENKEWEKIIKEDVWFDIVNNIIKNSKGFNLEENEKYSNYIEDIFKCLKNNIEREPFKLDKILEEIEKELFNNSYNDFNRNSKEFYNTNFILNLGTNIYIMKSIYNIFFEDDFIVNKLSINSETIENKMKVFAIYFISYRLRIASSVIFYIPSIEGDCKRKILDDMNFLESKSDFKDIECIVGDWVNTILKNIEDIDVLKINNKIENEFEKLYSLLDAVELYLKNKDILKYKDVKDDLKLSIDSIEDIEYFLKISKKLLSKSKKIEINNNNLVQNFINKCRNKQITPLEIRDFYDRIKLDSRIYINKKQIDELQNLISEHEKVNKGYAKGYRQSLLWHLDRINKSEEM